MTKASGPSAKLQSEELKDAYRVWLKDLYDEKPEKLLRKLASKKKKLGVEGRPRRKQRLQHAQQHTAASALKDVVMKNAELVKLPALRNPVNKQALHDSQQRRHQALVNEANYSSVQYAHQPSWRPGLAFFQQLVRHVQKTRDVDDTSNSSSGVASSELPGFPIQIAPILLRVPLRQSGGRLGVALLYCQEQNQEEHSVEVNGGSTSFVLHCRVYSKASSWRLHRDALLDIVSNSSAEVCAVKKSAQDLESRRNEVQLLRSRQEVEQAIDELWVDRNEAGDVKLDQQSDLLRVAIQKYIPFKGAARTFTSTSSTDPPPERKAWIARCASRKRDKNSSKIWIISGGDACGKEQFSSSTVTNSSSTDCQIVKCSIDQAWSEPRLLASTCAMSLETALRVRFNELVVDLLQDTSGTWWLLQVKAFTLASIRPASAASVSSSSGSLSLSKRTPRGLSRTLSAPTRFEPGIASTRWKKWRCAGRYCTNNGVTSNPLNAQSDGYTNDDDKEPSGYLTKKMLRSCEFYEDFVQLQDMSLAGGFTEFNSALAFHLQHRLPKRDRSQLYEPQPLCTACLGQYHSFRNQWMETIVAPKTSSTPGITPGHCKRSTVSKTYNEATNQIRLPPRHLPSLHRGSEASHARPILPSSVQVKSSNGREASVTESKQPNYLDELAAMEQMLAEHEPPSTLIKTTKESQSINHLGTTSTVFKPSRHDDIFPRWDGVTRIEAMWQDLSLKPLERQLADPSMQLNDSCAKQGYNSISLQHELAKEADQSTGSSKHSSPQQTTEAPQEKDDHTVDTQVPRTRHEATYPVQVQLCRRVFEDESYREELVNCAMSALISGKANVCFVVTPLNCHPKGSREDGDELAEMALRSLYIDVKQALAASSDDLCASSWPMRPNVWREASGCITVRLGAA